MKLVQDWKQAPKWTSVQALALIAALPAIWAALPPDVRAALPAGVESWITSIVAIGGILGRLWAQGGEQ